MICSANYSRAAWPSAWPASACTTSKPTNARSEEHTSELQSQSNLVCRLLLEKKNKAQFLMSGMGAPLAFLVITGVDNFWLMLHCWTLTIYLLMRHLPFGSNNSFRDQSALEAK